MLELASGDYRASLAPETGGAIARLTWRGRDVLRAAPAGSRDVLQMGCFPLAPFANRIARGVFSFASHDVRLAPNFGDHPHPLHGHAWRAAWRVESHGADRARMSFDYEPGDWPWAYSCAQDFAFDENGFRLTLTLSNRAETPMPFSSGFHPYFPRPPGVRLQADVEGMWRADAEMLPTELNPSPDLDLARGAELDDAPPLDNCLHGWRNAAHIRYLQYGLRLTASRTLPFLHLYTPAGESFFCAEPVSAMPNAFNRTDVHENGLDALAPGESTSVWMRIEASDAWSERADRA